MDTHILVVDNEADIAALVADSLAREGHRVSTATSGSEALATAISETPDLVIVDSRLPDLTSVEFVKQLRKRNETRDVRVILLTAGDNEPDQVDRLSLGADDYISKPFSPQELVLRVGSVLRRRP